MKGKFKYQYRYQYLEIADFNININIDMTNTKQGTSHFTMYVNIPKLTYILSRCTVLYVVRTGVRK